MNEQEQCQNWGDLLGNIVYDMSILGLTFINSSK
jgi:hypothetical protein